MEEQDVRSFFVEAKKKHEEALQKQKEEQKIEEAKKKIAEAKRKHKEELEQLRVLVACYPSEAHETLKGVIDASSKQA